MDSTTTRALLLLARLRFTDRDAARVRALSGKVNWALLVRQAQRGGVAGLVSRSIDRAGCDAPRDVRRRLSVLRLSTLAVNQAHLEEAAQLCHAAHKRGLTLLPFKGLALLLDRPYSELDLRASVDIDLVARRSEYAKIERLLCDLGFTASTTREHQLRHEHHVHYYCERMPRRVVAELHWTPFYTLYGKADADDAALARAVRHVYAGTEFTLLDLEDTLLSQLLHLALHRFRGELKWAVDVIAMLERFGAELRLAVLRKRAKALGASRALAFGLWTCHRVFDEPGITALRRHDLRWRLLRRLTPENGLLQGHGQPEHWRCALTDVALRDGWLDGLRHLLFKATEVGERQRSCRLPGWMTRRGLERIR